MPVLIYMYTHTHTHHGYIKRNIAKRIYDISFVCVWVYIYIYIYIADSNCGDFVQSKKKSFLFLFNECL